MIMQLDPATGLTIWNARSNHHYHLDFESDAGILSVVIGGNAWPTDRSEIALCATDPASGRVDTIEHLADVMQQTFRLRSTSPIDDRVYDVVGGIDGASGLILLPAEFDPSVPGPTIVVDEVLVERSAMYLAQEGALYFITEDGAVSKMVLSDQQD
jgi:hypothetical protein